MPKKTKELKQLSSKLIKWYGQNARDLPWRKTSDPFQIWLSEIILQQTTVSQGTSYYLKFIDRFPNVASLASAEIDEVLKLWQGLGYYSRARNLHFSAQYIMETFNGIFPNNYNEILKLKGVGPYTAAAISSFAFKEKKVVVDGNVIRFISRFLGLKEPVDNIQTLKKIRAFGQSLIELESPEVFNQAIMEFGALQCTAKSPNCIECPYNKKCVAFKNDWVSTIPLKAKKVKKRSRNFIYSFIIIDESHTIIQKRSKKDIWQGLYQFPLTEVDDISSYATKDLAHHEFKAEEILSSKLFKHILTHQTIHAQFLKVFINSNSHNKGKLGNLNDDLLVVSLDELNKYAWPRLIDLYLNDLSITLF